MKTGNHQMTVGEEVANSVTHGIGAALSVSALTLLIMSTAQNGNALDLTGAIIFGLSMVFLYLMSTLCHAFAKKGGTVRKVFHILDHSGVYVLIAGTYTPFCLTMIGPPTGYIILAIQWSLAIIGIIMRSVFYNKYIAVHVVIYLLMGWMIALFAKTISPLVDPAGIKFLFLGGVFYTIGVVFYAFKLFKYHHMIWHLCVLGGTVCHFIMVYFYVLPR